MAQSNTCSVKFGLVGRGCCQKSYSQEKLSAFSGKYYGNLTAWSSSENSLRITNLVTMYQKNRSRYGVCGQGSSRRKHTHITMMLEKVMTALEWERMMSVEAYRSVFSIRWSWVQGLEGPGLCFTLFGQWYWLWASQIRLLEIKNRCSGLPKSWYLLYFKRRWCWYTSICWNRSPRWENAFVSCKLDQFDIITSTARRYSCGGFSQSMLYFDSENSRRLIVWGTLFELIMIVICKVPHRTGNHNFDREPIINHDRMVRYFRQGDPSHTEGMARIYGGEQRVLDARWHVLKVCLKLNFHKVRVISADRLLYLFVPCFVSHCSEKLTEAKFHHLEKEAKCSPWQWQTYSADDASGGSKAIIIEFCC